MTLILNSHKLASQLPLDAFGMPAGAYSLRKLRSGYTGNAIRVRRSSDNTEQDIGFNSSGTLDVTALTTFVGVNTGYVTTWYDQSSNNRNASNAITTRQPIIVTGGVLETVNQLPALNFGSTGTQALISTGLGSVIGTTASIFMVFRLQANSAWRAIFSASHSTLLHWWGLLMNTDPKLYAFKSDTSTQYQNPSTGGYQPQTQYIMQWFTATPNLTLYKNNDAVADMNTTNFTTYTTISIDQFHIGNQNNSYNFNGHIQEVIVYGTYTPSLRFGVRDSLQSYYNVYNSWTGTGILDMYTGAAAAYSLRQLSNAYTGKCLRVRRSNDNVETDIGFDSSGNFNEAALTAFVGTNSGYVTIWYDQSGNGRHFMQSTSANQPLIVSSGTVQKMGTIAAINFQSSHLLSSDPLGVHFAGEDIPISVFAVTQNNDLASVTNLCMFDSNGQNAYCTPVRRSGADFYFSMQDNTGVSTSYTSANAFPLNTRKLIQLTSSGTNLIVNVNGSEIVNGSHNLGICTYVTAAMNQSWTTQELIFYKANKATDRINIRNNINTYFGVY